MLKQSVMYLIFKGVALGASILFLQKAGTGSGYLLILVLAFSCVLTTGYLFEEISVKYGKKIRTLMDIILLGASFFMDMKRLFPFLIVIVIQMLDQFAKGKMFYYLLLVVLTVTALIFQSDFQILFFSLLFIFIFCYTKVIREKGQIQRELVLEQKEELAQLHKKLADNKQFVKTLQYTTALEERNRLAARLHDKVGHGISGSIILLEASRLMMEQDLEKAKMGMDKAVKNLRDGVDDIRKALREERPVLGELGINEIRSTLEEFQVNYSIPATLKQEGNMDLIPVAIWQCIHDNLEEALTNFLKHSNGTEFRLSLQVFHKIIKVEYVDNGKNTGKLVKGLGLESIEERTIQCGGRCFFEKSAGEFRITNVYIY